MCEVGLLHLQIVCGLMMTGQYLIHVTFIPCLHVPVGTIVQIVSIQHKDLLAGSDVMDSLDTRDQTKPK